VLALLPVAVALGWSNFAASVGIGISGTDARTRLRIDIIFGLFETGMPVLGLLLGHSLAHDLGHDRSVRGDPGARDREERGDAGPAAATADRKAHERGQVVAGTGEVNPTSLAMSMFNVAGWMLRDYGNKVSPHFKTIAGRGCGGQSAASVPENQETSARTDAWFPASFTVDQRRLTNGAHAARAVTRQ
jgi:hypothetical protein